MRSVVISIGYLIMIWILRSVHLQDMVQRTKYYIQNQFFTFIVYYDKYMPKEFCHYPHPCILRACLYLSAWINATLWFLSTAAVSQGQVKVTLFSSKTTLGKNLYRFISHWLRENGLSFKKTSLRVGKRGMTLGIYFNLSWALLFSSVKCWAWSRRNLRSLPTQNVLGLH